MRFFQSYGWEYERVINGFKLCEDTRDEHDCRCILPNDPDIMVYKPQKSFIFAGHYDKVGRPILFMRFGKFFPEAGTETQLIRYSCWLLDELCRNMKANVDQYIVIYDFEDCGYSNFSLSHAKSMAAFTQKVFLDR